MDTHTDEHICIALLYCTWKHVAQRQGLHPGESKISRVAASLFSIIVITLAIIVPDVNILIFSNLVSTVGSSCLLFMGVFQYCHLLWV